MSQKRILGSLFTYMKKQMGWFVLGILATILNVWMNLLIPILTGRAIDQMLGPENVNMPGISRILVKILVSTGFLLISHWGINLCNNQVTYRITRDLRNDFYQKIRNLPLSYLDHTSHGDLISRVISDVDQVGDGLLMGFQVMVSGVLTILGTLVFMLMASVPIALVVVLVTPISLLAASFIAKKTYDMFHLQVEARGRQTALIHEVLSNQKVVKLFGREEAVCQEFQEINQQLGDCSLRGIFFSSITNPGTRFVNSLVYLCVATFGAWAVLKGTLSVGELSCFLSYANKYTKPFNEISGVITELQNALACAGRIFEFLEEEEMKEVSQPVHLGKPSGQVVADGVSFSYEKDRPLMKDFNLEISPGTKVAIVGPTGCGKTTLINLFMRFYDVDAGEIRMDDIPITRMKRKDVRECYGMVLQETWLKSGTIRENITFGCDEEISDDRLEEVARQSYCYDFIRRLPHGFDTEIGEGSLNLSQGQKQLLCIARVMILNPSLLILDEATSSIDTRTEMKIQKAFVHMMQGKTTFIVAHRLSTIRESDVILVMKDGNIIEQGNHEELMRKQGFYAELVKWSR